MAIFIQPRLSLQTSIRKKAIDLVLRSLFITEV
jgi:hypothetical protein